MLIFTLRRLNLFFFTMLVLTLLTFSLSFFFPGEQIINVTGQIDATPEQIALIALDYNKHESLIMQYWSYLVHLFNGDLGVSMASRIPIMDEMMSHLPATIELTTVALIIAMVVGIPIGFIAAIRHRKKTDDIILAVSMIGYSIPIFWLALLAILIFSIQLAWLPSAGQISLVYEIEQVTGILFFDILFSDNPYKWQAFQNASVHILLPACVVALAPATVFVRLARTSMLTVLDSHYIKAAMAKGLTFQQLIFRHAIKNAMVNVIRDVGLQFANLVTLAMVTEVIFNWPGIGNWLIQSIYQRDYTAIQGGLLALSSFIFIVHIFTDFIYASLNPLARGIKYGS
ncbi:ABC transporter permease subunit [Thalassotalea sp. 1_MG-2023]|uniref:ABC transporter permease n=1 Tax=Thalassotalea sp. 1_MG-2023 TaxID=3062680 RepID=UPI0026E47C53|nr:ABC transporter permease subunit [Thalassotalea sp. 1_MG-2023]MDO6427988.1 ABC transporter permease subunit [Thalassotalea sp. 1_MG-2023]